MKWLFWLGSMPFVIIVALVLFAVGIIGMCGELVRRSAAWVLKAAEPLPRWYSRHIPDERRR